MENDFCSYELALKLKACGFDEPCGHYYNIGFKNDTDMYYAVNNDYNDRGEHCCSAPLLYQAQKWLREKKGIAINVIAHDGGAYDYDIVFLPNAIDCDYPIDRATFSRTYEEALTEGIAAAMMFIGAVETYLKDCSENLPVTAASWGIHKRALVDALIAEWRKD